MTNRPPASRPVLRPLDEDALRAELRILARGTSFPVLFGGIVSRGAMPLSCFTGTRSQVLRGLTIHIGCGLGGRAVAERRPLTASDYFDSDRITHDYDVQVAREGIESLLAVPVVVRGVTRASIYGGLRTRALIGQVMTDPLIAAASRIAQEIEIRDEVDRRVALLSSVQPTTGTRSAADSARIIESYLALGDLAGRIDDDNIVTELRTVESALRTLIHPLLSTPQRPISRREFDVLSCVALGCRNAEIADRLSLSVDTVKAYMRNLMGKLAVSSRHEAVVEARKRGLLP